MDLLATADELPSVLLKMVDIYMKQEEEQKRQEMRSKLK